MCVMFMERNGRRHELDTASSMNIVSGNFVSTKLGRAQAMFEDSEYNSTVLPSKTTGKLVPIRRVDAVWKKQ